MNDSDVANDVRSLVAGIQMRTPVETIIARGRSHRRRRSTLLAAGTAAALAVTGLGVTVMKGTSPDRPTRDGHTIELAAFTVVTNPDGSATLTLTKGQAVDTETLTTRLAEAGVPAEITIGRFCHDTVTDAAVFDRVVSVHQQNDGTQVMQITSSAMPVGAKLSIGVFPNARTWNLITDGTAHTCTTDPN